MRHAIFGILSIALVACSSGAVPVESTDGPAQTKATTPAAAAAAATDPGRATNQVDPVPVTAKDATEPEAPEEAPAGPRKPATEVLLEVVYVIMNDARGGTWYCTGSLVSKDTVVTAGHCLERGRFRNYKITAPLAEGSPTVAGVTPTPMSDEFDLIENPDLGFLKLKTPIDLPQYAELTDISAEVEAGKKFTAAGVFRQEEKPISPLHEVNDLAVKSTVKDGYVHGFGVTLFSKGGDSGSGLFAVEKGQVTHKLIGVARQPDYDSNTDQVTRIDAETLAWLRLESGADLGD